VRLCDFQSVYRAALAAGAAGRFDEAEALLREARELAANESDRALADMQLAAIPVLLSDLTAELNVFRENLVRRHSPLHVWTALYYLLVAAVDRNDRAAAERYIEPLLEVTRELDEPERRLNAYGAVAAAEVLRGNAIAAMEYDSAALAEAESYDGSDAQAVLAITLHNFVYNCLAASEYRTALEHAPRALALAEELANPVLLRQCVVTVAFAYLCNERLDEAERLAVRAMPIAEGTRMERYVHYLRGEIARRRGDLALAAAHFHRLEPLYPEIPDVAAILLSMNVAPFLLPE
jgi:tetratricopeptide (TPR) repeat protein